LRCFKNIVIGTVPYHAAGLQEILAEAGTPKGSFYYYFKSKEDYCIDIIKHFVTQYSEKRLSLLYDKATPAFDRLRSFLDIERASYKEQDCPLGCLGVKLIMEMSRLSQPIRIELETAVKTWVNAVASCLKNGVANNEFKLAQSPERTAELINSLWIGAITRVLVNQSVDSMDIVIVFITEQLCQPC
jgi:TetR/AcrR family transcriptional repressor of nem operon